MRLDNTAVVSERELSSLVDKIVAPVLMMDGDSWLPLLTPNDPPPWGYYWLGFYFYLTIVNQTLSPAKRQRAWIRFKIIKRKRLDLTAAPQPQT